MTKRRLPAAVSFFALLQVFHQFLQGLAVGVEAGGMGACLLTAILVLAVMILPYIINISKTALDAVPPEYEEASLALGALRTETYFKVSLPAADLRNMHSVFRRKITITSNK